MNKLHRWLGEVLISSSIFGQNVVILYGDHDFPQYDNWSADQRNALAYLKMLESFQFYSVTLSPQLHCK